jgi:hypothetical protein
VLAPVSPIVMLLFAFVDLKVSSISVPYFHWPTLLKYLYWLDSEPSRISHIHNHENPTKPAFRLTSLAATNYGKSRREAGYPAGAELHPSSDSITTE